MRAGEYQFGSHISGCKCEVKFFFMPYLSSLLKDARQTIDGILKVKSKVFKYRCSSCYGKQSKLYRISSRSQIFLVHLGLCLRFPFYLRFNLSEQQLFICFESSVKCSSHYFDCLQHLDEQILQ